MKKLNYFLVPVIIVLIVSNIFLYSSLSKQNSGIKKDISDLKQEQINQQAGQKEAMQNLQDLVTFNWKKYENHNYGFSFKYPDYTHICDYTLTYNDLIKTIKEMEKAELIIGVGSDNKLGSCITGNTSSIEITITKNVNNYKTAEEAFYKEFPDINKSLNNHLNYFKKMGVSSIYGGNIINQLPDERVTKAENYGIIALNGAYIIKVSDNEYEYIITDTQQGNKPIFDAIISTLFFEQPIL